MIPIPRKRNSVLALAVSMTAAIIVGGGSQAIQAAKPTAVTSLGFQYKAGKSALNVTFDQDVTFKKTVSEADNQVIIEVDNAKISPKWARRIDASQHPSNVSLISPYQDGDNVKIVVQLKQPGDIEIAQNGKALTGVIDNKQEDAGATPAVAEASPPVADAAPVVEATPAAPAPSTADAAKTPADPLDAFSEAQRTKTYVGKKITLQLRDAELADVFNVISEASEFNIVISDAVKGKTALNLQDVPWDQALDTILQSYRLAAERRGNILRVTTLDEMRKEKEALVAAQKASEAAEPIVVRIFPISYAKIDDLKKIFEDFLSGAPLGAVALQSGGANVRRGSIQIDQRTNSLIVRDTPTSIEKIARLVKELDTQTPQILIEAKFVEVKENNTKEIQGRLFTSSREFSGGAYSFNADKSNYGAMFNGSWGGNLPLPDAFSITSTGGGGSFGFMPRAGLLPGIGEIGAFLNILENESSAKIVASPRVITQNKETAEIVQGKVAQLAQPAGANASGGFTTINITLKLNVTPQVTNEGTVSMKISFSQDTISPDTIVGSTLTTDTKKVDTNVLVDSGATVVIGGVYSSELDDTSFGIPLLRDLPIVGFLFGSKKKLETKNELFIFLTPRIINDREAGVSQG